MIDRTKNEREGAWGSPAQQETETIPGRRDHHCVGLLLRWPWRPARPALRLQQPRQHRQYAGSSAAAAAWRPTRSAGPGDGGRPEGAKKPGCRRVDLDVRTPEEWNEYHVPGSTSLLLDELPKRVAEVPKDKEVVVVCRSGNRSATGRDVLLKAGYPQVTSLGRVSVVPGAAPASRWNEEMTYLLNR